MHRSAVEAKEEREGGEGGGGVCYTSKARMGREWVLTTEGVGRVGRGERSKSELHTVEHIIMSYNRREKEGQREQCES